MTERPIIMPGEMVRAIVDGRKPEHQWAANPWVWVVEFRREEGQE